MDKEIKEQSSYNIEDVLKKMGFNITEKQREMLATRGRIFIYYAVDDGEHYDEMGHPTGMVITRDNRPWDEIHHPNIDTLYAGKQPSNESFLVELMKHILNE